MFLPRVLILLPLAGACSQAAQTELPSLTAEDGTACIENREQFLSLDYWTFDQDPSNGVRAVFAKPGCELAAADLIRDYHKALRDEGTPIIVDHPQGMIKISENGTVPLLYWHEGQARAFQGEIDSAIELFRRSLKPESKNYGAWNEYVHASIAFLRNDLNALQSARDEMAGLTGRNALNLGVVDGLIACFGETYSIAYGAEECNRRPASVSHPAEP